MKKTEFNQLYLQLLPNLYNIAMSILRNHADTQDAIQETALKAWMHSERIRNGTEKAYVTRILINECRNICRKSMRMIPTDEVPLPETADRQAADRDIRLMLEGLPERQRVPIVLHYLEGFSLEEIARVQHLTLSMVKYLMHQARKTLRLEMDGKEAAAK